MCLNPRAAASSPGDSAGISGIFASAPLTICAIPFDTPGAELFHYEESGKEFVSFDAIIRKYKLTDPALLELAHIVRGADANIPDMPAESPGLEAAALGFRHIAKDDHENMKLQFPFYDAMYAFVKEKVAGKAKLEHAGR